MRTHSKLLSLIAIVLATAGCARRGIGARAELHTASSAGHDSDDAVPLALEGKFTDGSKAFSDVKDELLQRYVSSDVSEDDLYRAAIAGMLEYVEPKRRQWNKLLSPTEMAELKGDLQGRVTGVGIRIGQFDPATGYTTVMGTIPGSAADRAGVVANDIIVTVDGKLFKGRTVRDIIHSIRGKEGETVTLAILRGDRLVTVPIRRETIELDNIAHRMLAGGIGYVLIRSFTSQTPDQLATALGDLASQGARGMVLDLRQNQGGGFEQAVSCGELLSPPGDTIVSLEQRGGKEEPYLSKSTAPRALPDVPMIVLVDHDTSSGAELLSAALRDDRHAQLVGTRTYGKWTVQTLEELSNGYAIKFTIGVFKSPSGGSYEGTGLTPDVEVDMDSTAVERAQAETDPERQLAEDQQLRTAANLLAMKVR